MRNLAKSLSSLLIYFVLVPHAFAASFDCSKAETDTELLDDDGSLSEIVHYLIASRTDPELKIYKIEGETGEYFPPNCVNAKHESAVPYFAVKKEDLVAKIGIENPMEPYNPNSKLRSFWERREVDGTAEITWSILLKLRDQLN